MSYVEVIYIDREDNACRKTGLCYEWETPLATWAAFRAAKPHQIDGDDCTFLLDYYNRKGDLADTICINDAAFREITGERVKSNQHYRDFDRDFWRKELADMRNAQKATP